MYCRWFLAYAMCSHLFKACELYNHQLTGYKQRLAFTYRKKRGNPAKSTANQSDMYLISSSSVSSSSVSASSSAQLIEKPKRKYTKRTKVVDPVVEPIIEPAVEAVVETVVEPEKRKRGRPRKVPQALEQD